MTSEAKVSAADNAYFNAAIQTITTESSVLISNSKYLNNAELRHLIAQEMLRRNGADVPSTAFIPEVAQILHALEDVPAIIRLFEEEKARLPEFKAWLDRRELADFTKEELKGCAPGTLGAEIHDFMVRTGYELNFFFREVQVVNDYTFYLRQTALCHDIEHIVTGFGPNHGGEIALLNGNMYSKAQYFRPELAAFFNRIPSYLKSKTILKNGLHYPEAAVVYLEGEYRGVEQARNWKYPIMLVNWRDYTDWQLADIRAELGITPLLDPSDLWDDTTKLGEDPRIAVATGVTAVAAE